MRLAMALYGTENLSPELALKLGISYFSQMGLSITGAAYYTHLINGDHVGDHNLIEITLSELTEKVKKKSASAFRLYNESGDFTPWSASYGFNTNDFGSFYHIDAQSDGERSALSNYVAFFKEIALKTSATYGIVYQPASISKGFNYASGANFTSLYPYESSVKFNKEALGLYGGQKRYCDQFLRMVYEINLLNLKHLSIDVAGKPLRNWISESDNHGMLEKITESLAIWHVKEENLDDINNKLGNLGILLSWNPTASKKHSKKLP